MSKFECSQKNRQQYSSKTTKPSLFFTNFSHQALLKRIEILETENSKLKQNFNHLLQKYTEKSLFVEDYIPLTEQKNNKLEELQEQEKILDSKLTEKDHNKIRKLEREKFLLKALKLNLQEVEFGIQRTEQRIKWKQK